VDDITTDRRQGVGMFGGSGNQIPDTSLDSKINFVIQVVEWEKNIHGSQNNTNG
jgi:hypothetical protein